MKYFLTVKEVQISLNEVVIEADSEEEAREKAGKEMVNGQIVFDDGDIFQTQFEVTSVRLLEEDNGE